MAKISEEEEANERYANWLKGKAKFNLDCYYCIYESSCNEAHTWNTGEKECKGFRGA